MTSRPALSLGYHTPKLVHPRAAGNRNGYGGGGGAVGAPVGKGSGGGGGRVAGGSDGGGTSCRSGSGSSWRGCDGGGFAGALGAATASEHVLQTTLPEGRKNATRRDRREVKMVAGGGVVVVWLVVAEAWRVLLLCLLLLLPCRGDNECAFFLFQLAHPRHLCTSMLSQTHIKGILSIERSFVGDAKYCVGLHCTKLMHKRSI